MGRLLAALLVVTALAGGAWRSASALLPAEPDACCCAMAATGAMPMPAKHGCGCHVTPTAKAPDFAPALPIACELVALAPAPLPTPPRALGLARRAEVPVRGRDPPDGRRRWLGLHRLLI